MISVYRKISGVETEICTLSAKQSEHKTAIRGLNEIQISITVDVMLPILEGDYIKLNGVNYTINRDVEYTIESDVKYSYDLAFEHPFYVFLNKLYCNRITGDTTFTLTGKLIDFVQLLVWCVNISSDNTDGVDTGWTVGNIVDTDYKNLTFTDLDCVAVLNKLADEFQVEYFFNNKQINFVERIERVTDYVFQQGAGKGLYRLKQQNVDKEDTVTRLIVRGGNKNVPNEYADNEGYLKLPENYLEDFSEHVKIVERKKKFEEEFPRFVGSIATVSGDNNKILTCPQIDFDVAAIAVGDNARINFLTGDLMGGPGYKFNWDNTNKQITLIEQEDETALADADGNKPTVPNVSKKAKVGDKFNFTGVLMPASYVTASITRLREKGNKYLGLFSKKRVKFTLDIDHRYMRGKPELIVGDLVVISIPQRNFSQVIRITELGKNLHTGEISATVSNYLEENWERYVESKVENVRNEILAKQANVRNTLETIFKDGIVTETELKSIEAILTNLSVERGQLNAQYLVVRGNVNLINKTPLETAWSNYQTAFVEVETEINNAIADKLISDAEKANIDNKISVYSTRTNEFATALENARVAIEDNKNQGLLDVVDQNRQYLQDQIDGVVDNWFYPYSPTLANYPASDWTTNAIKDRHVGDTFTNTAQAPVTDAGKSWRFVKNGTVYSWTQIADSDAVLALQKAAQAQATADGKSTTHLIQPTSYKFGDMWVLAADQTVNGIAYKSGEILTATQDSATYNQTHWVKKVRYTDDAAVENLQIGTRNFYHSNTITENYDVVLYKKTDRGFEGIGNLEGNFPNATIRIRPIITNGDWTLKFKAKSNANVAMRCDMCDLEINTFNLTTEWQIFEFTQNIINYSDIYNFIDFVLPNYAWYYIDDIVVVQGNKAPSSFIEAPEDVQAKIDAAKQEALDAAGNAQTSANNANTAVGDLNTYVDGSFKDGVIEASEAKAIEKYINIVNTEKSNLEATYNTLYTNTYLDGMPKTNLLNAKVTYFGAVDTLLGSINTAISDGKTTTAEKNAVDSNYTSYKSALASLQTAIENANKAIQTKLDTLSTEKVDNIRIGVRNFFKKTTPLSAYWQYPPYTNISDRIEKTDSGFNYVGVPESPSFVRADHVITGNGEWTVSFEVQSNAAGYPFYVDVCDLDKTEFYVPLVVGEWGKCELTVNVTNYGDGSVYNFVDFSDIQYLVFNVRNLMVVYGNKAPESWIEAPEDVQVRIDEAKLTAEQAQSTADGYMRARYVRDWLSGNTDDMWSTWGEIKIHSKDGSNVANGKSVTGSRATVAGLPLANVTDGQIDTYCQMDGALSSGQSDWVIVDLGQIHYDIESIDIWHYYADGRTYYGTKTEISVDGVNWTTVFDSAKSGTYKETAAGNIITFRPNEVLAKILKGAAVTDKFGVTIEGGLIGAVTMLLRELNSTDETAGISGIRGANRNLPAFWTGTYADAIAGTAGIIFRHNSTGKIGVLDVDANGNVKLLDAADPNLIRLIFSKSQIPLVADILSSTQFGQSVTNLSSTGSTTGSTTLANGLSVTKDGSELTFSGILSVYAILDFAHGYTSGYAEISISLFKNGFYYAALSSVGGSLDASMDIINETYNLNSKLIVPSGNYTIVVQRTFYGVRNQTGGISNTSTFAWSFVKDIRRFEFGLDGYMSWYTNCHSHFTENGGYDGRAPYNKWNMPGVLAAGSSTSGGIQSNVWGAKSSTANITPITGGFRVPLSDLTHSNYVVQITPHTNTTFRVGTKTSTYFEVYGTGGFDYVVIGNNYA